MRIFFFDTETTGLPRDWKAPVTDLQNWPRMIQVAYQVYEEVMGDDGKGNPEPGYMLCDTDVFIIKPEGFEIPDAVAQVHGITQARALEFGVDIPEVLDTLHRYVRHSDLIVGHNISFDRNILGAEFLRAGLEDALHGKTKTCTMMASTKFCAIPGKYGPKWPKLQELHNVLFGADFEEAHDAAADIAATAKCYFELVARGVMKSPAADIANHMANKAAKDAMEGVNR